MRSCDDDRELAARAAATAAGGAVFAPSPPADGQLAAGVDVMTGTDAVLSPDAGVSAAAAIAFAAAAALLFRGAESSPQEAHISSGRGGRGAGSASPCALSAFCMGVALRFLKWA